MDPTPVPKTMRAWQFTNHNRRTHPGIENNLSLNTVPVLNPSPDQHLIQVIAAALNPADWKRFEDIIGVVGHFSNKNATPGIDYAGRIVVPAQGSPLQPGQLVFGPATLTPLSGQGSLIEYALVPRDQALPIPDGLDPVEAAGITVAGISGYQSVLKAGRNNAGQSRKGWHVFINGGSGGTGLFGIQFAKIEGMRVTVTCSANNTELVKSLGADDVIDYREAGNRLVQILREKGPFDLVVDNAGYNWDLYWRAHEYLKPEATYVMVAGGYLAHLTVMARAMLLPVWLGGGKRPLHWFFPDVKVEDLQHIAVLVAEGKVKTVIDERFKFEDVPQAFKKLKTGRAKGKIIIEVENKT